MKPGRELDALIAEKIFNKSFEWRDGVPGFEDLARLHYPPMPGQKPPFVELPRYSTDISAAWEVVGKLQESFHLVDIQAGRNSNEFFYQVQIEKFNASKSNGGYFDRIVESTEGESIPHSICLAAIKTVLCHGEHQW